MPDTGPNRSRPPPPAGEHRLWAAVWGGTGCRRRPQAKPAKKVEPCEAPYRQVVSLNEAEFFEAGMALPPDVRKHVALRLLGSVDPDEAFDVVTESWLRTEAAAAYDALRADPSRASSSDDVRARLESKWSARP